MGKIVKIENRGYIRQSGYVVYKRSAGNFKCNYRNSNYELISIQVEKGEYSFCNTIEEANNEIDRIVSNCDLNFNDSPSEDDIKADFEIAETYEDVFIDDDSVDQVKESVSDEFKIEISDEVAEKIIRLENGQEFEF